MGLAQGSEKRVHTILGISLPGPRQDVLGQLTYKTEHGSNIQSNTRKDHLETNVVTPRMSLCDFVVSIHMT